MIHINQDNPDTSLLSEICEGVQDPQLSGLFIHFHDSYVPES